MSDDEQERDKTLGGNGSSPSLSEWRSIQLLEKLQKEQQNLEEKKQNSKVILTDLKTWHNSFKSKKKKNETDNALKEKKKQIIDFKGK